MPEVLEMRAEGMTWAEIAQRLGTTPRAVESAVQRRRKKEASAEGLVAPARFPDMQWPEDMDWRELLDTWEAINQQHKRMDPYVERFTVDMSDITEPIAVVAAADLHMGGGFTDHKAIRETIELILSEPELYVGITGDSIEGFIPGIKPAETVEQQAGSVKAQLKAVESLVNELADADKLLWMTWGDHDAKWFEQTVGFNIVKHLVHKKVPYFTGRGLVRLLLGSEEYFLLINHGEKHQSMWNPNHPQRRAYERHFPADVVIAGHLHKPAFQMFHHYDELRRAGLNLGGEAWLVQTGTYKTGPDPYSIRTWSRGVLGVPTMIFSPDMHNVDVVKDPVRALRLLRGLKAA